MLEKMRRKFKIWGFLVVLSASVGLGSAQEKGSNFPPPFNTEDPSHHLPPAQDVLAKIETPPGFKVTLFASEPDVQNPIAITTDDRGRLWIAENYTYAESG